MMYREHAGVAPRDRATITGQVFGLLGFSMLFTAAGAVLGPRLGLAGLIISAIGMIGSVILLNFVKEKTPLNLGIFYLLATCAGMLLGVVVESYIARGQGSVVMNAAGVTAALVIGLGAYSWTTKRDLTGMSGALTIALFAVFAVSLVYMLLRFIFNIYLPALSLVISGAFAVIFGLFLMVDLQRVRETRFGTQGDAILLAVAIFLDIYNLFLNILQIFGILGGRDD